MRQLLLLALAVCAGVYARQSLGPLQESVRSALALSDNQIALLQGPAIALSTSLASIPLGLLVDRYSRVRLLLVSILVALAGSMITAWAPCFWALFFGRSIVGLAHTAPLIAGVSLIADLYSPEQRGRAVALLAIGEVAGSSTAFAFGGLLLTLYGADPKAWRWTVFWMTGPSLALVTVSILALHEPKRTGLGPVNTSVRV